MMLRLVSDGSAAVRILRVEVRCLGPIVEWCSRWTKKSGTEFQCPRSCGPSKIRNIQCCFFVSTGRGCNFHCLETLVRYEATEKWVGATEEIEAPKPADDGLVL
jgi:hypothetical protein